MRKISFVTEWLAMVLLLSFCGKTGLAGYRQNIQMEMRQTHYASSSSPGESHRNDYSDLLGRYQLSWDRSRWRASSDVGAVVGLYDSSESYVVVPELYVERHYGVRNKDQRFILGRQLLSWSEMDDFWGLGLWQPYFRWDQLSPEPQGLTGFVVDHQEKKWGLRVLASPVFIPDQGPNYTMEKGRLYFQNRWQSSPPSEITIGSSTVPIRYKVQRPSATDVISHSGAAVQLRLGDKDQGTWTTLGYAYKPMNQFHLEFDGYQNAAVGPDQHSLWINVYPEVVYHNLWSGEVGYSKELWRVWSSVAVETPVALNTPDDRYSMGLDENRFLGLGFSHKGTGVLPFPSEWSWVYLKRWSEEKYPSQMPFSSQSLGYQMDRYLFSDMAGVEVKSPLWRSYQLRLEGSVRYFYSWTEQGGWLSTQFQLLSSRRWALRLGFDIFGSQKEDQKGFFAEHRHDDRVQGGLRYVF